MRLLLLALGLSVLLVGVLLVDAARAQDTDLLAPDRPTLEPSISCVEPTTDTGGRLLGQATSLGKSNGLVACWAAVKLRGANFWAGWLPPDSPAGGKRHPLGEHLPGYIGSFPVDVLCGCFSALGWGKVDQGRVTLMLIDVP